MMKRQHGFTLVELIVVMVLIGILGGILALQLGPAIQSYLLVGQRAGLTNQADTALRRLVGEVRAAVPNSVRPLSSQCIEMVPSRDGGRYRSGPDTQNDTPAAPSAFLETDVARSQFDVLTPFAAAPAPGDRIVIGNQNPDDVYGGVNVGTIQSMAPPPAAHMGAHRITLQAPMRIPPGYEGGRFVVVPGQEQAVTYACDKVGTDPATGTGTGTLYRFARTLPAGAQCTLPASAAVLADKVSACSFLYEPNQGATQEAGFVQARLTITERGESASLVLGAHVDNVP